MGDELNIQCVLSWKGGWAWFRSRVVGIDFVNNEEVGKQMGSFEYYLFCNILLWVSIRLLFEE